MAQGYEFHPDLSARGLDFFADIVAAADPQGWFTGQKPERRAAPEVPEGFYPVPPGLRMLWQLEQGSFPEPHYRETTATTPNATGTTETDLEIIQSGDNYLFRARYAGDFSNALTRLTATLITKVRNVRRITFLEESGIKRLIQQMAYYVTYDVTKQNLIYPQDTDAYKKDIRDLAGRLSRNQSQEKQTAVKNALDEDLARLDSRS